MKMIGLKLFKISAVVDSHANQRTRCPNKLRHRAIIYVIVFAIVNSPWMSQQSRADTPVAIPAVVWWLGGAVATGVVHWAVSKILDKKEETPPPAVKANKPKIIKLKVKSGDTNIDLQIEDPITTSSIQLNDSQPNATIHLPSDWVTQPTMGGDTTQGTFPFHIDNSTQQLFADMPSSGTQIGSDIHALAEAADAYSGTESWTQDVVVNGFMARPTDGDTTDSVLTFNPSGSILLSTTDLPDTSGTVGYMFNVNSPELGGTLLNAGVTIDQGATTYNLINGGIPGATYTLLSPGVLQVDFSGTPIQFGIPNSINYIDFSIDTQYIGQATLIPEPVTLVILALGGLVMLRRQK